MEEGRQEGRRMGREIGLKEGKKEACLQAVLSMISQGMPSEFISKITQMPVSEIDGLREP